MITLIVGITEDGKQIPITYIRGSRCYQQERSKEVLKKYNTNQNKKFKHYKPIIIKSHLEMRNHG